MQWNETARSYPREHCVHELFAQQAERTPDAITLVCDQQQLTYRQLDERANRLGHYVRSLGVRT